MDLFIFYGIVVFIIIIVINKYLKEGFLQNNYKKNNENDNSIGSIEKTHKVGYFNLPDKISSPDITKRYMFMPENMPHLLPKPANFVYDNDDIIPSNYIFNNIPELNERYPKINNIFNEKKIISKNLNYNKNANYIYDSNKPPLNYI